VTGPGTVNGCMANPYEAYGFTVPDAYYGTCPSPDGGAGQGQFMDPITRQQFREWLWSRPADGGPWCTVLSLINPHDIQFYPYYTRRIQGQQHPRRIFREMAANYETNAEREAQTKPQLQRSSVDAHNDSFGDLPDKTRVPEPWRKMLDTDASMTFDVDLEIYSALKALSRSPFADNTIIVFTSDHGECAGAHGTRGKGFSFYEEGSRLPLTIKDPTGGWTPQAKVDRRQLFSSVNLAPLMLTLATGSEDWRKDGRYAQIANAPRSPARSPIRRPRAGAWSRTPPTRSRACPPSSAATAPRSTRAPTTSPPCAPGSARSPATPTRRTAATRSTTPRRSTGRPTTTARRGATRSSTTSTGTPTTRSASGP
jgi:arylsulfatase A-like enzyme